MHILIPVVLSADGKMSKGPSVNPHSWASHEDSLHVVKLLSEYKVLVMGRNTFETGGSDAEPTHLRVVLTSAPEKFHAQIVPGQLEFMSAEPTELVAKLEVRGINKLLVFGGRPVHSAFLAAGLVDEIMITIEPHLFGNGLSFLADELVDIPLHLESVKRLNEQGTLLLHYRVIKS